MLQDVLEAWQVLVVFHSDLKSVIHRVLTVLLAILPVRYEIHDEILNLFVFGGRVEHDADQEKIQIEQGMGSLPVHAVLGVRTAVDPRVRKSGYFCHAEI